MFSLTLLIAKLLGVIGNKKKEINASLHVLQKRLGGSFLVIKHLMIMDKTLIFLVTFCFSGSFLIAQTVNSGKLYVSPNTEFSTLSNLKNTDTGSLFNDGTLFCYANFYNNGEVDHYEANAQVQFVGFDAQLISGEGDTFFSNILFKNKTYPVPFLLQADINIEGEVDFNNGIIDNRNYGGSFLFGETARYKNASNISYVDGSVEKIGNTEFEFPIGHQGYYRTLAISDAQAINPLYKATYFLENPDTQYPLLSKADVINTINNAEYWKLEPVGTHSEVVVTLSWNEATTSDLMLQNTEALHIVRWDEEQQLWVDEGGVVDEWNKSVSAVVSNKGIFTLAIVETDDILPCELVVYNAITPNKDGKNDYFLIDQLNNGGCAQNISVKIFNRWSRKVFETTNYGLAGRVFDGHSNKGDQLPAGTYFYVLEFEYETEKGDRKPFQKQGYLYLNGN